MNPMSFSFTTRDFEVRRQGAALHKMSFIRDFALRPAKRDA